MAFLGQPDIVSFKTLKISYKLDFNCCLCVLPIFNLSKDDERHN